MWHIPYCGDRDRLVWLEMPASCSHAFTTTQMHRTALAEANCCYADYAAALLSAAKEDKSAICKHALSGHLIEADRSAAAPAAHPRTVFCCSLTVRALLSLRACDSVREKSLLGLAVLVIWLPASSCTCVASLVRHSCNSCPADEGSATAKALSIPAACIQT